MRKKKGTFIPVRTTYDLDEFMDAIPENGPRILHADIETSLMLVWTFGTFKQNIPVESIVQDWNILSFCAKWDGVGPALYQSLRLQKNPVNDFSLCKSLHRMLSNTDIVVAHNGKRFDLKKIRARMALNRMQPIPNVRIIDTLLESRKQFGFTSQKLIYLSDKFGPDGMKKNAHGKFPGLELWRQCQAGNQEAWDEMEAYNIPDVLALEGVYREHRGWYQGAQNLAVFTNAELGTHTCPNCASQSLVKRGCVHTQVSRYQRFQCRDCGGWSRGRTPVQTRGDRAHIKMN